MLGKKHQGKKSYTTGGLMVVAGLAVALGYEDPTAQVGGGLGALAGLAVMFVRSAIAKVFDLIEEKSGYDIPDQIEALIAEKAEEFAERGAEKALAKVAGLADTPETGVKVPRGPQA